MKWAKDLKSEDFELLCPKGGRAAIDKFEECHIAKVPRNMVRILWLGVKSVWKNCFIFRS